MPCSPLLSLCIGPSESYSFLLFCRASEGAAIISRLFVWIFISQLLFYNVRVISQNKLSRNRVRSLLAKAPFTVPSLFSARERRGGCGGAAGQAPWPRSSPFPAWAASSRTVLAPCPSPWPFLTLVSHVGSGAEPPPAPHASLCPFGRSLKQKESLGVEASSQPPVGD